MNAIIACLTIAFSASAERLPAQSLKAVVDTVQSSGEAETYGYLHGELLGFQNDVPSRYVEKTQGSLTRNCRIVLDEKNSPVCLILGIYRENKKTLDTETVLIRVEHDGTVSRAFKILGKIDPRGEPVEGSGTDVPLSVESKSVFGDAKAELEYWLRQFKRKSTKRAAAPAASLQPLAASK